MAEAYRESGKLGDAVRVLETSLNHRPRDPRGRVALARCRFDLQEPQAAADLLEAVIRQDPAHVEANKMLLEAYLRTGEPAKAEERLNIYRLLNDRDPELAHLEYRLEGLRSNAGATGFADPASEEPPAGGAEAPDVEASAAEADQAEASDDEEEPTPTQIVEAIAAEAEAEAGGDSPGAELESADSPAFELAPVEPEPSPREDLETTEATSPLRGHTDPMEDLGTRLGAGSASATDSVWDAAGASSSTISKMALSSSAGAFAVPRSSMGSV
ncbi:MAG: tetratricopeptide repeat protein [Acidobacteriota bacterium]